MPRRPALALSLYVSGRRAVVVGDGPVAEDRRTRLSDAGATVVPVSSAQYRAEALEGATLVLCCDPLRAEEVGRDARARGALFYAADRPELSDFALPALARRGPVTLAASTDGTAPALARRLREELERLLATGGEAFDTLVRELTEQRDVNRNARDGLYEVANRLRIDGHMVVDPAGGRGGGRRL